MIKAVVQAKYGSKRIYFAKKEHREIWENMTKKKTISMVEVKGLRQLGLDIDVVDPLDMIEE